LGHIVSKGGIATQHSKLSVIQNWTALTDIKSVCAFVSLWSYYHKSVRRFAEIAQPLTDLLWEDGWKTPFSQDVLDVVDKLKETLRSSPVLQFYDVNTPTCLYVDASGQSIGVVFQQIKDGSSHPIGYYSRRLTPAEMKYAVYDREFVDLRDSCLHFRYQFLDIRFTVRTDHSSLQ
jgi:hypothetical protein